jgi:hypothetical protein
MAILEIPIDATLNKFTQSMTLDGVTYGMDFFYNSRMELWTMTLKDVDDTILLAGIPLQTELHLTKDYAHLSIPKGEVFLVDTEGNQKDAGTDDFGDTIKLLYNEAA